MIGGECGVALGVCVCVSVPPPPPHSPVDPVILSPFFPPNVSSPLSLCACAHWAIIIPHTAYYLPCVPWLLCLLLSPLATVMHEPCNLSPLDPWPDLVRRSTNVTRRIKRIFRISREGFPFEYNFDQFQELRREEEIRTPLLSDLSPSQVGLSPRIGLSHFVRVADSCVTPSLSPSVAFVSLFTPTITCSHCVCCPNLISLSHWTLLPPRANHSQKPPSHYWHACAHTHMPVRMRNGCSVWVGAASPVGGSCARTLNSTHTGGFVFRPLKEIRWIYERMRKRACFSVACLEYIGLNIRGSFLNLTFSLPPLDTGH